MLVRAKRFCAAFLLGSALAAPALAQNVLAPEAARLGPFNCAIRPTQTVEIAAPVAGIVDEVLVRPGAKVEKGQIIARFDSDVAAADLDLAQARAADTSNLELARVRREGAAAKVARLEVARRGNAVSAADLDAAMRERDIATQETARAEAALRQFELEAARAGLLLEKAVVRSPVAGTVEEGLIDPGETPTSNQPLATITAIDPLRVEAFVPTAVSLAFVDAQRFVADIAGAKHELEFDYAATQADLSSTTRSIFFTLRGSDILPGYDCFVTAE